jgi:hypothetical protein
MLTLVHGRCLVLARFEWAASYLSHARGARDLRPSLLQGVAVRIPSDVQSDVGGGQSRREPTIVKYVTYGGYPCVFTDTRGWGDLASR